MAASCQLRCACPHALLRHAFQCRLQRDWARRTCAGSRREAGIKSSEPHPPSPLSHSSPIPLSAQKPTFIPRRRQLRQRATSVRLRQPAVHRRSSRRLLRCARNPAHLHPRSWRAEVSSSQRGKRAPPEIVLPRVQEREGRPPARVSHTHRAARSIEQPRGALWVARGLSRQPSGPSAPTGPVRPVGLSSFECKLRAGWRRLYSGTVQVRMQKWVPMLRRRRSRRGRAA